MAVQAEEIQFRIDELINQVYEIERDQPWISIKKLFDEADRLCSDAENPDLMRSQVHIQHTRALSQRRDLVDDLFKQAAETANAEPLDANGVLEWLNEATRLAVDEIEATQRRQEIWSILESRQHDQSALEEFYALEKQVKDLWDKGDEAFRSESTSQQQIVEQYFQEAFRLAETAVAEHPDDERFQSLLRLATERRDDARTHANIATTFHAIGQYDEIRQKLEDALREDPEKYFGIPDPDTNEVRMVHPDEGLRMVQRYIGRGHETRIFGPNGYIDQADQYLADHNPIAAHMPLQRALDLPDLPDDFRAQINNKISREIEPETAKFREAEVKAQHALKSYELPEALRLIQEAQSIFEWAPQVKRTLEQLRSRGAHQFHRDLKQIESMIEMGKLGDGSSQLDQLRQDATYGQLVDDIIEPIERLQVRISVIQEEQNELPSFLARLQTIIDNKEYREASQQIDGFLDRFPNASRRSPEFDRLRRRVDAHVHMERLPRNLEESYNDNHLETIIQAIEDAQAARESDPTLAERHNIPDWQRQLRGRMRVLQAEQAWRKGDDAVALEELRSVADSDANRIDQDHARQLMRDIRSNQQLQERIRNTILPQVEEYFAGAQYLEAFRLLDPIIRDALDPTAGATYLPDALRNEGIETWGRVTAALIHETIADLQGLLDTRSQALDDLLELRTRLNRLGVTDLETLGTRLDERIAVLSAERAEESRDWSSARRYWNQALDLNPDQPNYKQRMLTAHRQEVESRVNQLLAAETETGENQLGEAARYLREYMQERPDYIEPRAWYLNVLFDNARAASDPVVFEDRLRTARRAADVAANLAARQPDELRTLPEEKAGHQQLDDVARQVDAAREHARTLAHLDRVLQPSPEIVTQDLPTLQRSSQQMRDFLKEHTNYIGLDRWWNLERFPRLLDQLRSLARSTTDYWVAFRSYARLLVLMADDQDARHHLYQLPGRASELTGMARMRVDDNSGVDYAPRSLRETNGQAHNVVVQQIEATRQTEEDVGTALTSLRFFTDLFEDSTDEDDSPWRDDLKSAQRQLRTKIEELNNLAQEYRSALTLAIGRGMAGLWDEFEKQLDAIRALYDSRYANHIAISLAEDRRAAVTERRNRVRNIIEQIKLEFNQHHLVDLKTQLETLRREDEDDECDLQEEVDFFEPLSENTLRGIAELESWLMEVEEQLDSLTSLLAPLVRPQALNTIVQLSLDQMKASDQTALFAMLDRDQSFRFINWPEKRRAIDNSRQKAHFGEGHQQTLAVIDENGPRVIPESPLPATQHYGLTAALEYAHKIRPDDISPRGYHPAMLLKFAQGLRSQLETELREARNYLDRIRSDAQQFAKNLADFDLSYQKVRKNKSPQEKRRARDLHRALTELASEYTGIHALEEYNLLAEE